MQYTSVLQVPNSKGSRLLREISKIEPRLAKITKYNVKLVEKGGKPLSNMFNKNGVSSRCHRVDCHPCSNQHVKGNSLCGVRNVVYEARCNFCEKTHALDRSRPHA